MLHVSQQLGLLYLSTFFLAHFLFVCLFVCFSLVGLWCYISVKIFWLPEIFHFGVQISRRGTYFGVHILGYIFWGRNFQKVYIFPEGVQSSWRGTNFLKGYIFGWYKFHFTNFQQAYIFEGTNFTIMNQHRTVTSDTK